MPLRLTHATIVTADAVLENEALTIEDDGRIGDGAGTEYDCHGALLIPGAIDLHCDAVEKVVEARPGVLFPLDASLHQCDVLNAAAGITTVYHAISFEREGKSTRKARHGEISRAIVEAIAALNRHSAIDHRRLLRYEVTNPEAEDLIRELIAMGMGDLVSINDHSPGQGQFKNLEAFVAYYTGHHGLDAQTSAELGTQLQDVSKRAYDSIQDFIAHCHRHALPVASHDDDSRERVQRFHDMGVGICEFPINLDTARAAQQLGVPTILGAPNIIRGGSQSGSMRALDAVVDGCCTCLCADYAPWTLVMAALQLPDLAGIGLPEAICLISAHPADAAGLHDRGRIAPGLRADLALIDTAHAQPRITRVWSRGRLAYGADAPLRQAAAVGSL